MEKNIPSPKILHNPGTCETLNYGFSICECHSPKKPVDANQGLEGQGGEVPIQPSTTKSAVAKSSSPSSFEDELRKIAYEDTKHTLQWHYSDILELKEKYCLDKAKVREALSELKDDDIYTGRVIKFHFKELVL